MKQIHQFQNVVLTSLVGGEDEHGFSINKEIPELSGASGVVLWQDFWDSVLLVEVQIDGRVLWLRLPEERLEFIGGCEPPDRWLGTRHEVSFDTVEAGREGCLRRPGTFWECFFFQHGKTDSVTCQTSTWRSGITGHLFIVPEAFDFRDESLYLDAFATCLGMSPLHRVRGPDSTNFK